MRIPRKVMHLRPAHDLQDEEEFFLARLESVFELGLGYKGLGYGLAGEFLGYGDVFVPGSVEQ